MTSGTTATGEAGGIVGVGDAYVQAKHTLKNIASALASSGHERLLHSGIRRTRIGVSHP